MVAPRGYCWFNSVAVIQCRAGSLWCDTGLDKKSGDFGWNPCSARINTQEAAKAESDG